MPTHGSLSKAGKVRSQTPKIESASNQRSSGPRVRNRKLYHNRITLGRNLGQYKPDYRGRRY